MEDFFRNYQYTIQFFVALGTIGAVISTLWLSMPKKEKGEAHISLSRAYTKELEELTSYIDLTVYNKGQVNLYITPNYNLHFIDDSVAKIASFNFLALPFKGHDSEYIPTNSSNSYLSEYEPGFLRYITTNKIKRAYMKTKSGRKIKVNKKSLSKFIETAKKQLENSGV